MTRKKININETDSIKMAEDILSNLSVPSDKKDGEMVVNTTIAYIQMMNELNARHITYLEKALLQLKSLKKEEAGMKDEIKIARVRAELTK